MLLAIGIRFLSLIFLQFREMFFKLFAAFINAKLPSGLFEPLGLLFVSQLRFRLCFFGAPAFAIWWLAGSLFATLIG